VALSGESRQTHSNGYSTVNDEGCTARVSIPLCQRTMVSEINVLFCTAVLNRTEKLFDAQVAMNKKSDPVKKFTLRGG